MAKKVAPKKKPAPKPAKKPAAKAKPPVKKAPAKKPAPAPKPVKKVEAKAAKPPAKSAAPAKIAKPDPKAAKPAPAVKSATPPAVVKKGKPPIVPVMPAGVSRLMDMKGGARRPLISSGPKAAHVKPLGAHNVVEDVPAPVITAKSTLSPEQLAEFRDLLVRKRAVLVGDVHNMEAQALTSGSGSLSNMPSHLAEQGSEAYDQSLSLDLAAADRKLIKEIDDAISRIDAGTYGICEATGKPIKLERLRELPWARYSIEAAREIERQSMRTM